MTPDRLQPAAAPSFRLSPQQERMWTLGAGHARYRSQCAARIQGAVDRNRIESALEQLGNRHEILRTVFVRLPGMQMGSQLVLPKPSFWLEVVEGTPSLEEVLAAERRVELDIEQGPLLRVAVAAQSSHEHLLVLTIPGICADRKSLVILLRELGALYGAESQLDDPLQYADYAEWRHEMLAGADDEAALGRDFWRQRPATPDLPPLLFGRKPSLDAHALGVALVELDKEAMNAVRKASAELRVTPGIFLEACCHVLAARLSGQTDVSVTGTFDGRVHEEVFEAVGPLAQPAAIPTHVGADTSLAEVVDQIRRARRDGERWQDQQPAESDAAETPLAFDFLDAETIPFGDGAAVIARLTSALVPAALQLILQNDGANCRVELVYEEESYARSDVEQIARHFCTLISDGSKNPNTLASQLKLLPDDERDRVLAAAHGPDVAAPAECMHSVFEQQVERVPNRVAVQDSTGSLTYRELDEAANRLAHYLREQGVGRNSPVGLCFDRSTSMVVSLVAILKAGGAYVPLSYEHPPRRLAHQLTQAGAKVVVTQDRFAEQFASFDGEILCVDRDRETLMSRPDHKPEQVNEPEDLVYVMYTSGSTGLPKGVAVTHRNLVNYTKHMIRELRADNEAGLTFALVSAISTDLGNTSVFPALASGGSLHLIPPDAALDGAVLAALVHETPIDVLKITPTHLEGLLATVEPERVLPRHTLVLGGEACAWTLLERVRASAQCRIINHYGPTETTVGCSTFDVATDVSAWRPQTVPIGRAIANASTYVLDGRLEPVPTGVAGELYVGGAGVSRGYVGDPEQTAARFIPDPFADDPNSTLYRTGDRVRVLGDGNLEFLGRVDHQVKIRGHRIEPAEIEAALAANPAIRQVAVIPVSDNGQTPRLIAYLVGREHVPSVDDLRSELLDVLPEFMVPAEFRILESLPLTASGKIDRMALPAASTLEAARQADYVAPRTPEEQAVAEIWQEVLGAERVGVHDDFFALGGHSLMATQVIARARARFDADVQLLDLFTAPTVQGLAAAIATARNSEDAELEGLVKELSQLPPDEASLLLATEPRDEGPHR